MNLGIFLKKYKNDEACLEHIKSIKYPNGIKCEKCQTVTKFTKITGRPVYQCSCGYQVSPLAHTIFEKTTTPLQYWFYAIFIIAQTRSGVSAKQLQRELGVTYKTAWRMFKQIRMLMAYTDTGLLDGVVEIDETYIGGKGKNRKYQWRATSEKQKEAVMGMIQRNGKAYLKHIPDTYNHTLIRQIKDHVEEGARVMTDQLPAYKYLRLLGYEHKWVNHKKVYVVGDVHTQNAENVWSHIKRGIYGVYRNVSKKYLQAYVDEYSWRYNHRKTPENMFNLLLAQVAEVKIIK